MKKLVSFEKDKLGERIKKLREMLCLTQNQLGDAIGASRGTIQSMENGRGFTGDILLAVTHFFGMSLTEFSNYNDTLPNEQELRKRIKSYHIKNKSTEYKVLEKPPQLASLIEFRLSKTDFLKEPKSVAEIIQYCYEEYGLDFKSSAMSQALKNATITGTLKRIKSKGRNYRYQIIKQG